MPNAALPTTTVIDETEHDMALVASQPSDPMEVVFIGPSGSGKSTGINALLGYDENHPNYLEARTDLQSVTTRPRVSNGYLSASPNSPGIKVNFWDTPGCPLDTQGRNAVFSEYAKHIVNGTADEINIIPPLPSTARSAGAHLVVIVQNMDKATVIGPNYAIHAEMSKHVPQGQCMLVLVHSSRPPLGHPDLEHEFQKEKAFVKKIMEGKPVMPVVVFGHKDDKDAVSRFRGFLTAYLMKLKANGVPPIQRDVFRSYYDIDREHVTRLGDAQLATANIEAAKAAIQTAYEEALKEYSHVDATRSALAKKNDKCTKAGLVSKGVGAACQVGAVVVGVVGAAMVAPVAVIVAPILTCAALLSWLGGAAAIDAYKMVNMSSVYVEQIEKAYRNAEVNLRKAEAVRANSNHDALLKAAQERVTQAQAAVDAWNALKQATSLV